MANVNRLFPQVGLQGGPTGTPQSGATPVADTIGKIAGVAGEFAQKYKEAQYASDATDAELEIQKRLNAYKENLRTNPIQAPVGGDIVKAKEEDWNNFSADLQKSFIDGIENTELKTNLSTWWKGASENGRAGVVEKAQDENIIYMGEKQLDRINDFRTLAYQTDDPEVRDQLFDNADRAASAALSTGLISRSQYDEQIAVNNRTEVTAEALTLDTYQGSRDFVQVSNLSAEQKAIATQTINNMEEAQTRREEEELKVRQDEYLEQGFFGVSQEQFTSMDQLDRMLAPGGVFEELTSAQGEKLRSRLERDLADRDKAIADAQAIYEDQLLEEGFLNISTGGLPTMTQLNEMLLPEGRYGDLDASQGQRLRTALTSALARKEKNDPDDFAKSVLDKLFRKSESTRDDILNAMFDLGGMLSTKSYNYYYGLLDDEGYKRLNSSVNNYVDEQMDAMVKEGLFGEDPTGIAQARFRIENFIHEKLTATSLSERDRSTEQGFQLEDAQQLFYNERQRAMGFDFKETDSLREGGGDRIITDQEKLIKVALNQGLFGQTSEAAIDRFIKDSSMNIDDLREVTAKDRFNLSYSQLSKDQKNEVGLSEGVGKLVRQASSLFRSKGNYPGVDAIPGYEVSTGLPTMETQDNIYRLGLDKQGNEERWEIWQNGTWVPDYSVDIPDLHKLNTLEKTVEGVVNTYEALKNVDPASLYPEGLTRESETIAEEQKRLREEELKLADEESGGTPLGQAFRRLGNWAFPNK